MQSLTDLDDSEHPSFVDALSGNGPRDVISRFASTKKLPSLKALSTSSRPSTSSRSLADITQKANNGGLSTRQTLIKGWIRPAGKYKYPHEPQLK